jgi:M6 family metalloprotease-like protein
MRGGKEALRGALAAVAAIVAMAAFAGPAHAATCDLSGSGPEGPTDTSLYQVPGATLKASMIFVDFSDHPASAGEAAAPQSTIGLDLAAWATDYIDEVSYGRTQLDLQMGTSWIRMGSPSTAYSATSFAAQRAYIAEAVQKANTAGFDFTGRQTVYVVAAPTSGVLPNSPAFHAFASDAIFADGTAIRWGSSMGDDIRRPTPDYGSHVLVHETGHTFGLPDLYRYGQSNFDLAHVDAGSWDLMGWIGPGFGMTAWHKRKLGWLAASEWTCVEGTVTAHVTSTSAPVPGGTKMLVTRASPTVAYVAEVREPVGTDTGICDTGVLIYRVDANAQGGFLSGVPPLSVKLAHPGDPGDPSDQDCGALSNAPFGDEPGQTSTFTEGAVTINVLSGDPATGFDIQMTGPILPPDTAAPPKKKCKKGQKLKKVKKKLKCVKKKKKKRKRR